MPESAKIIELLLKEGLVTQEQINNVKDKAESAGSTLEKILEEEGVVSPEDITKVRASELGVPYIDLEDYHIDRELIKLVPENLAKKYKVVPLFTLGKSLSLGMVDPQDIMALDEIRQVSKMDVVEPVLVSAQGIKKILDSFYGVAGSVEKIVGALNEEQWEQGQEDQQDSLIKVAEDAPIVKLVNVIIEQGLKERASDIHIEPEENMLRVRYRIDGMLHEVNNLPKKVHRAVVSRIKLLSNLDIAENRKPQDGRMRVKLDNRDLDIRVSTCSTIHGENVVMRILDRSSVLRGLKDLGLPVDTLKIFNKLIRRPYGIILVTGPTGSGKTTTLYAALSSINSEDKNIITIEDPVEYEFPLIRQMQVNIKAGVTFASGLRSMLRQDPDVIMVGEIRDKETAEIAVQAALTGHLVFSTLHTNDAASALTRIIEMGMEPFLISSAVIGILAQRLVGAICEKCKQAYAPENSLLKNLRLEEEKKFYRGAGCPKCKDTGLLGRIGIYELLVVNEQIRKMIINKESVDQIRQAAKDSGMKILKDDGLKKVAQGATTIDEVLRATEVGG